MLCYLFAGQVEFLPGVEARALFEPLVGFDHAVCVCVGREVAVSADAAAGKELLQLPDKLPERAALCRRTGVCRTSAAVETALVTDAYRVGVEAFRMGADAVERTGGVHRSIRADVVVIACAVEAAPAVHPVEGFRRECRVSPRGAAMHHD